MNTPDPIEREVAEGVVQTFLKHTQDRTRSYLDNHNNREGYDWFVNLITVALQQVADETREEGLKKATYNELAEEWLARYEGIEHMHVKPEVMYTINTILRRCFKQALTPPESKDSGV